MGCGHVYPGQLGLRVFPPHCWNSLESIRKKPAGCGRPPDRGRCGQASGGMIHLAPGPARPPAPECTGTPPLSSNIGGVPSIFFQDGLWMWPDRKRAASQGLRAPHCLQHCGRLGSGPPPTLLSVPWGTHCHDLLEPQHEPVPTLGSPAPMVTRPRTHAQFAFDYSWVEGLSRFEFK